MTTGKTVNTGLLIATVIITLTSCGGSSTDKSATQPTDTSTQQQAAQPNIDLFDAKYIINEYDKNEVAANQLFKGKTIAIKGRVEEIGETIGGIYVTFGDMFKNIQFMFPDSEKDTVAKLQKGQELIIIGNVDGRMLTTVTLSGCYIHTGEVK